MIGKQPTLRPGDVIEMNGCKWLVEQVSPNDARCSKLKKRSCTTYICAQSEIEVIGRRPGLIDKNGKRAG